MKTLIATLAYYPYVGGHAVLTRAMAEGLAKRGHDIFVLTSNLIQFSPLVKTSAGFALVNRIPVLRFDSIWPDLSNSRGSGGAFTALIDNLSRLDEENSSLQNMFILMRSLSFPFSPQTLLWGLTSRFQASIIHAIDLVWSTSFTSFLIAKKKRIPFVITPLLHTHSQRHRGESLSKVMREASAVIAVTESEQEFILKKGVEKRKVHHISLGIDTDALNGGDAMMFRQKYKIPFEDPIILFIGRKEVDKGVIQLIKAMNYVWKSMPKARLVIVGPNGILPTDVRTYRNIMLSIPPEKKEKVLDLGVVHELDKLGALAASDILAMPSVRESFGLVYLEAWYYHKPVIGAACKPVSDIIDHQTNGLLVRFGDEKHLAESLLTLLKNEKIRKEYGDNGYRKLMMKYTANTMIDELEKVYQSTVMD
ncbi:MAG: glycosyltransferase family 4 protein [Methanotrichaceae archaeon]|nr:glycosyltransferase family 4 protein [Methanotrichaceae archaeon]